jgi:hypothetical protein
MRGPAFFAYSDNYLIDVKFGWFCGLSIEDKIRLALLHQA